MPGLDVRRIYLKHLALLPLLLFANCAGPPYAEQPWTSPVKWSDDFPEWEESTSYPDDIDARIVQSLSDEQRQEIKEMRSEMYSIPINNTFSNKSHIQDAYAEWFVKGYTLTVVTGIETIRPQYFAARTPESEAMVQGWHAGQELARSERRDQLIRQITNSEPNKPGGDNPD